MTRTMFALRALLATTSAAVLAASSVVYAQSAPAGRVAPVTVLELSCLRPGDAELRAPVHATTQDGTRVELWCGSRIEVSDGRCAIRVAAVLTTVPCVEVPRPSGAGALR